MNNEELAHDLDDRIERLIALVAAVKKWDPLLHPRGKDGKFIEKGGWIRGLLKFADGLTSKTPERAEVMEIRANPDHASNPLLDVKTSDGRMATVVAGDVDVAPSPKGYLKPQPKDVGEVDADVPTVPDDGIDEFNAPEMQQLTPDQIRDIQSQDVAPVQVSDMDEAVRLLEAGTKIELVDTGQIPILLDKLREIVADAEAKGVDAPVYNLCNVTAKNTSLFCVESKGIPRIKMPQLSGKPTPGSEAAKLTPDSRGEVDLGPQFREMLEARGVQITDERVEAQRLKASQNELDGAKTAGIAGAIRNGTYDESALFISNDNYIVDGHHRWSAMIGVDTARGPDEAPLDMPIQRVDMSILDLLAEANDFAIQMGIPQAAVGEGRQPTAPAVDAPDLDVPDAPPSAEEIAKLRERVHEADAATKRIGWMSGPPGSAGSAEALKKRQDDLRDRVHQAQSDLADAESRAAQSDEDRIQALRERVHGADDGIAEFQTIAREITPEDVRRVQGQDGPPVQVYDVDEALTLLAEGVKIELVDSGQIAVMLDRMREIVADAKAKGVDAPNYDLCNVTARNTSLFCTDSKGIPRIKMPQLSGIPLPGTEAAKLKPDSRGEVDLSSQFRQMLEDRGIRITDERVEAQRLKASQNELNGAKTAGIANAIETGTYDESPLFISSDNYIVDGHHRWSATIGVDSRRGPNDPPLEMPVMRVDMSILDLLAEANDFAISRGIPQQGVGEGQIHGLTTPAAAPAV